MLGESQFRKITAWPKCGGTVLGGASDCLVGLSLACLGRRAPGFPAAITQFPQHDQLEMGLSVSSEFLALCVTLLTRLHLSSLITKLANNSSSGTANTRNQPHWYFFF